MLRAGGRRRSGAGGESTVVLPRKEANSPVSQSVSRSVYCRTLAASVFSWWLSQRRGNAYENFSLSLFFSLFGLFGFMRREKRGAQR